MPKLRLSHPKYQKHKASGQAFVKLDNEFLYLGPHGTAVSMQNYDRVVMEWLANGRSLPSKLSAGKECCSITRLCIDYLIHAQTYYRKHGRPTGEHVNVKNAIKHVRALYGDLPADEFSPLKLEAVLQRMIAAGISRKSINKHIVRIKRMFRWGASKEKFSAAVCVDIESVESLKKGRTDARETRPVQPIPPETVVETLRQMHPIPADMVRVQLLTGARPGEICMLRPGEVNRTADVWVYQPMEHKTEHANKERIIFIGPEAQEILRPYLERNPNQFCFSPAEAVEERNKERRSRRRKALKYEYRNRKQQPKCRPGAKYSVASYRRAIHRGCDRAYPAPDELAGDDLKRWRASHRWSPNRLRHTAATEIRKKFGLEAAQVILGHSSADITQIYAELHRQRGMEIIKEIG